MSIGKLKQYQDVDIKATLATASPHKQIDMLFEGAMKFLVQAKAAIEHGSIEGRTKYINNASNIVFALNDYLDFEKGGAIAEELSRLYDYMLRRMVEANRNNSAEACDEVVSLLTELRQGWISMPAEYK
ncbi:MAG: flagellar export chaperone FliS [Marinobacterium sp.]|nr:flagellar export chaperone FliS [Marinobacterium sp.]